MTTKTTFTASDIVPTNTVKDTAQLLASLIGEGEIFAHQSYGDQVGAVSANTWNSEITLTHAAASRLLGAIRRSLIEALPPPTEFLPEPFLTLSEEEAVEVYAALALAAQIYATTGDRVMSGHYAGLNVIFQDRDGASCKTERLTPAGHL